MILYVQDYRVVLYVRYRFFPKTGTLIFLVLSIAWFLAIAEVLSTSAVILHLPQSATFPVYLPCLLKLAFVLNDWAFYCPPLYLAVTLAAIRSLKAFISLGGPFFQSYCLASSSAILATTSGGTPVTFDISQAVAAN